MKLLKNFAITTAAIVLSVAPAHARVEDGTGQLLKTLDENGINIIINADSCNHKPVHGSYSFAGMKRTMTLCPGSSVDAIDHATVRHETVHAIQHCVNVYRGTAINSPIASIEKLVELVNEHLSSETVEFVKSTYPESDWAVEMEANLLETAMTAEELEQMFLNACVDG